MSHQLLEQHLKRLRMPTVLENYRKVADEARQSQASFEDYLCTLLEQELSVREVNAHRERLYRARFPMVKTLDAFDFSALPTLNKQLVLQLFKGAFIDSAENIIFMGGIGTGKTHLAIALGAEACRLRKKVRFYTVASLINELIEAHDERKLNRFQQQLAKYDLLILDELGMVDYDKEGANKLFQVLSLRYERRSTVITTNLEFKDWTQVFGSQQLTAALVDRLTHRCHILEMNGESYRFKESLKRKKRTAA